MGYLAGLQFRMNVWPEGPDIQVKPQSLQVDVWASVNSTFYTFSGHVPTWSSLQPPGGGECSLFTNKGCYQDFSPSFCISLHRVLRQGQNLDPDFQYISWSAYQIPKTFSKELLIIFRLNLQTQCSFPPFSGKGPAMSFPARNTDWHMC